MLTSLNIDYFIKDQLQPLFINLYSKNKVIEYVRVEDINHKYYIAGTLNILSHCHNIECTLDYTLTDLNIIKGEYLYILVVLNFLTKKSINKFPFEYQSDVLNNLIQNRSKKMSEKIKDDLLINLASSQSFIDKAKSNYQSQVKTMTKNEKYDIESIFNINENENDVLPVLSFKIGSKKKYIIKSVHDFINKFNKQENHKYGKELEFVHAPSQFSDDALKTIDFIKTLEHLYSSHNMQVNNYNSNLRRYGKEILIETFNIDTIFDFYKDENGNTTFVEKDLPVKVEIKKGKFAYKISLRYLKFILGDKYIYTVESDKTQCVISRIKSDSYGLLRDFIKQFEYESSIYISINDYQEFYRYVLMPIKDYLDIKSDETIDDNNYSIIHIYGDINEQSQVYFKVYYVDEDQRRIKAFHPDTYKTINQDIVENYFESQCDYIEDHIVYFDMNNDKTVDFLLNGLEFLSDYAQIFVSESLKKIGKETRYTINAGVRISNDLLAIDIESDQIPKSEIGNVLDHYRRKKKYYRLKNGDVLFLNSPELEELDNLAKQYHFDLKSMKNGYIELNKNKALSLDKMDFEHIQLNRNKTFTQLIDNFENKINKKFEINKSYNDILRDYQKDGLKWLNTLNNYGFNGILADDMGLGKTLQVISLLEHISSDKPSLVVAPASLIYNWEDEVCKFSKTLKVKCITGNKEERQRIIKNISDYNLYITSYDYIRRDIDMYENITFNYVVLDEAQNIKNANTINAKSVKQLNANHKLALTGTPIENTLAELWSIFDFLMPDYLYNYHYFRGYFENDIVKNNDENKIRQLKQMVTPFILRRNKKDVLKELPEKIERTQYIPFNKEESEIYYASLASANEQLQDLLHMENVNKVQILALLTRLRQLCCEPRMVYENIESPSSKLNSAIELISTFNENKQQVLLFSSFTQSLDLIAQELSLHHISYEMLTGSTPKEKRRQLVEQFQNKEFTVFLISLKAGGTGLNLTNAEAVIHFDPWWNISAQNQATDRAYRIGQHNNVQVYKLVMKESIEEKIIQLQQKKKDLSDMFVENNEGSLSQMTTEEIKSLFTM